VGGGSGSDPEKGQEGGGGGGLGRVAPAGYVELKDGRSRFVPIVNPARMALAGLAAMTVCAAAIGLLFRAERRGVLARRGAERRAASVPALLRHPRGIGRGLGAQLRFGSIPIVSTHTASGGSWRKGAASWVNCDPERAFAALESGAAIGPSSSAGRGHSRTFTVPPLARA
jgi:hypothetical protein